MEKRHTGRDWIRMFAFATILAGMLLIAAAPAAMAADEEDTQGIVDKARVTFGNFMRDDNYIWLRDHLKDIPGFISVERFESLTEPGKLLSVSFWENEEALAHWRRLPEHRDAQGAGRDIHFADYRLRVAGVIRDYGLGERAQAPEDSRALHG